MSLKHLIKHSEQRTEVLPLKPPNCDGVSQLQKVRDCPAVAERNLTGASSEQKIQGPNSDTNQCIFFLASIYIPEIL